MAVALFYSGYDQPPELAEALRSRADRIAAFSAALLNRMRGSSLAELAASHGLGSCTSCNNRRDLLAWMMPSLAARLPVRLAPHSSGGGAARGSSSSGGATDGGDGAAHDSGSGGYMLDIHLYDDGGGGGMGTRSAAVNGAGGAAGRHFDVEPLADAFETHATLLAQVRGSAASARTVHCIALGVNIRKGARAAAEDACNSSCLPLVNALHHWVDTKIGRGACNCSSLRERCRPTDKATTLLT